MILVIMSSKRLGINPDNVATPIAAALGDLITLTLFLILFPQEESYFMFILSISRNFN